MSGGPVVPDIRAVWQANTVFSPGDVFTYNGGVYEVTTTYTSGGSFGATDLANTTAWEAQSGTYARYRGRRAVGLGDSLCAGLDSSFTNGNQVFGSQSWYEQACLLSGGRIHRVYNAGIGGNTLAQMYARLTTDVIAYSPDFCFVMGGTNDVGPTTLASMQATMILIVTTLLANGIVPILLSIPPRNDDPATCAKVVEWNMWLERYAAAVTASAQGKCHFIDCTSALVDPTTGTYITGLSNESVAPFVHATAPANHTMGQAIATACASIFPAGLPYLLTVDPQVTSGQAMPALVVDPLFYSTDSGSGRASAWNTNTGGGATGTYSLGPASVGVGNKQVISKTSTAGTWGIAKSNTGARQSLVVGNRIAFAVRLQTAGLEDNAGTLTAQVTFNGAANTPHVGVESWKSDLPAGSLLYGEAVVPAGTTSLTFEVTLGASTAAPTTVSVEQFCVMDLTAAGIA